MDSVVRPQGPAFSLRARNDSNGPLLLQRRSEPATVKSMPAQGRRRWCPSALASVVLFTLILAAGLWLRGNDLARTPPTGDESESSLNALTILRDGLPRDQYLGLLIYENCLTEPWPDHPEYEFRDSSYSRPRGLAIYHGWLPLYAMAGSFKAFGVAPDAPIAGSELRVRHTGDEIRRRIIAARAPSIVFGGLFMIFLFLAAREMCGLDAALAAMFVGAIGRPFVWMGREARYHAATMALSTACCWAAWRLYTRGRWRDHFLAAACLVLLFYTHLLAFGIACAMFAVVGIAAIWRRPRVIGRYVVTGLILAACTAPWLVLSGFFSQHAHIPPAREFLSFPADLVWYPLVNVPYLLLPLVLLAWLVMAMIFRRRLPPRVIRPLAEHARPMVFLLAWVVLGLAAFTFFIPAASYFYKRLTLAVVGPGVVWAAVVLAATARAWKPRWAVIVAPLAFAVLVIAGNLVSLTFLEVPDRLEAFNAIERLRATAFPADTKFYSTPNDQLTLTFLTGLPVQSIAPVRKSFLDSYPGPMLIIDSSKPYGEVNESLVMAVTEAQSGKPVPRAEARQAVGAAYAAAMRQKVAPLVASVDPPAQPDPPYTPAVVQAMHQQMDDYLARFRRRGTNTPLLRGFALKDWSDWWPLFFYRFVDPVSRMGDKLNYADRIRSSRAEALPSGWVFYHCPPRVP
jgi:4-amino-4-deoxy-L-arabinose transferase-like glycosyltransferase